MAQTLRSLSFQVCIDIFNRSHKKFKIKFADEQLQNDLGELVKQRINLRNPWDCDLQFPFDIDFPKENDESWIHFKIKELETMSSQLPIPLIPLPREHYEDLYQFSMGTFRLNNAPKYHLLAREYG